MKVGTLAITNLSMQRALVRISRNGERVIVHHTQDKRALNNTFYQLQNGQRISAHVIRRLIDMGLLVPVEDGLFQGYSQTLMLAPFKRYLVLPP